MSAEPERSSSSVMPSSNETTGADKRDTELARVEGLALRRARRKATWVGRVRRTQDAQAADAAERDWWIATSPCERIQMVDEVSADAFAMSGINLREQRLQRSVTRILRRGR